MTVLVASSEIERERATGTRYTAIRDMEMRTNAKNTDVMKVCDDDRPMSITVSGVIPPSHSYRLCLQWMSGMV